MRDLRSEEMGLEIKRPALLAIIVLLIYPLAIRARQAAPDDKQASGTDVTIISSSSLPVARLLPDSLAGHKATTEIRQFLPDSLAGLDADRAIIYREYLVTSAASREYAGARVDLVETQNQFAAFGLFTFSTGASESKPIEVGLGSSGSRLQGALVFWKENFFVRVIDTRQRTARGRSGVLEPLARAIADAIVPKGAAVTRPPLLESLPAASIVPGSKRYFRGPESLNAFVEHAREMFTFDGDTEAVMGEYLQGEGKGGASDQTSAKAGTDTLSGTATSESSLKLLIVEYHTPQFATDAIKRVTGHVSSLTENEQQQIIVKRTGNYIVAAVNVRDREFAEGLINSVQYPYTVKWLRNPLWPTNDPFRTQKAAEMLLSTFGLLGLILLTVLLGGAVFGTTIFLKRRKRQQEIFSDAGGMLRLDIDPFESVILGLPPKRSEE